MVQKTVNAEAKAGLRSSTMVWDSNIHYFRSYFLSNNISLKVQTQSSKNSSYPKKLKPKNLKSASLRDNMAELPKKNNKKDKKKRF